MNWIQNFIEKLKKEEVLEEEHQLHNTLPAIPKKESRKELDTRIAYQYPKGNFRFPVIPDEIKTVKQQQNHFQQNKQQSVQTDTNHEERVKQDNVYSKKEPIYKPKRLSSGPFRPTEIPSPIFGFNRPKKTAVEHELSHFSKDMFQREESSLKTALLAKEALPVEPAESLESEVFSPDPTSVMEKISEDGLEKQEDSLLSQILFSDNPVMSNTSSVQEEVTDNRSETRDTIIFEEDMLSHVEIGDSGSREEKTAEGSNETAADKEDESSQEQSGDTALIDEISLENKHEHLSDKEQDEIQAEEHYQSEVPKRTHLPFNVLMLKQDKQKWEEKSKRQSELLNHQTMDPAEKTDAAITNSRESAEIQPGTGLYDFPSFELLKPPVSEIVDTEWLMEQESLLNQTLENFNVGAKVVNVTQGPSVTRFEVQPEPGVKVNKVTNLTDDIKLSLAARDIRIEAPIPGKHTIGIEVPNQKSRPVLISEIVSSKVFCESASPLTAVLGLDISGKPIVTDLKKMPHGLIAGATGSGKSVCINTILISLLYKASPEDLKLMLIDPKMVELAPYNQIPHLVAPVITDVKAATAALKWAVEEMERRYELFAHTGVRDINRFNELALQHKRYSDKLPFIVIIIDELADLMMMSPADVEEAICRIAQKARACGIHLIIATQRPSVDVITGLIKANIPTRIAFSVSSQVDSRTIIDISGAERLLGRGDMLFLENGSSKPVRLQGTFVSDEEIDFVVGHVREQREPDYLFEQEELLKKAQISEEEDDLFYDACEFVVDQACASTSSLQRRFKIGYNRAARLMDLMEQHGYISSAKGSKPRDVLITAADLDSIQEAGS